MASVYKQGGKLALKWTVELDRSYNEGGDDSHWTDTVLAQLELKATQNRDTYVAAIAQQARAYAELSEPSSAITATRAVRAMAIATGSELLDEVHAQETQVFRGTPIDAEAVRRIIEWADLPTVPEHTETRREFFERILPDQRGIAMIPRLR